MATHGVVMEGGRVLLTGAADEVRNNPEMATCSSAATSPPRSPRSGQPA